MNTSFNEIEQIARYSTHQRPPHLSDRFSAFVGQSSDELYTRKPARVDVIIATPATKWSAAGQSVVLYTFARFRKYFTVIEDLAPTLARVYLETGVLPIVAPVRAHFRRHTFEVNPNLVRFIRREGLKLYSRARDDG